MDVVAGIRFGTISTCDRSRGLKQICVPMLERALRSSLIRTTMNNRVLGDTDEQGDWACCLFSWRGDITMDISWYVAAISRYRASCVTYHDWINRMIHTGGLPG